MQKATRCIVHFVQKLCGGIIALRFNYFTDRGGGMGWLKVAVATPEISLATLVAIQQMMMFLLLLLFSVYFEKQNMQ